MGEHLGSVLEVVGAVERWLREAGTGYRSHAYSYQAHAAGQSIGAGTYLNGLKAPRIQSLGVSSSAGVIFRSEEEEGLISRQMTVDASLKVPDGLFMSFTTEILSDALQHSEFLTQEVRNYRGALQEIDLALRVAESVD